MTHSDEGENGIVGKYRRSDLETFDGCPYRFDQVVRQGHDDQSDEAKRGVAFHIIAHIYVLLLVASGSSMDVDDARQAFVEGLAIARLPTHLATEVAALWRRFSAWFELNIAAYLTAEEQQMTRRFRFRPDLVLAHPNELEIKDWKTYYRILTEQQIAREFQVKFYLWQAMQIWPGFDRYRFTMVFVRFSVEVSVVFTREEITAFEQEIEGIVKGLEQAEESNQWPAIPGAHCTVCRLKCPIADNPSLLPVRVTTRAEAVNIAGKLLVMEQAVRAARKALSGYTQIEGPFTVNGQEFMHSGYSTTRYPLLQALGLCDDAGFDMSGATVSRSGLGFKQFPPALGAALAKIAISARRSKFRHRKAGEDIPADAYDALDALDAYNNGGDDDSGE